MIDFYTGSTPNGQKISVMLEEIGMTYNVHKIDIYKGEQFTPEFVTINPNSKIPAIVDRDINISVFESGAILIYLAEKSGKLLPTEPKQRFEVLQWLMFQMSGVGPMMGQLAHFLFFASEKIPYAIDRYKQEVFRQMGVLDKQLAKQEFLCGDYSIADIATFPWIRAHESVGASQNMTLDDYPHLQRWSKMLQQRPAIQRGMAVPN